MNIEKEIEKMAKILFESGVALDATDFAFGVDGDDHFTRLAIKLVNAGYGNVKQAVEEFWEKAQCYVKALNNLLDEEGHFIFEDTLEHIDDLITELYGADQ